MIVHPGPRPNPGEPNRRVPQQPPKRDHDRILDPGRHGGAVVRPPDHRDGRPISQQPLQNRYGRVIAPRPDHIREIEHDDMRRNLRWEQEHWNRHNDHGYYWHNWNGREVCHHYDDHGFHWWGFYVGSVYFWTRYWDDTYWWYDPYWHRWVYLHDSRWWWRDPVAPEVVYVYTDDGYYRYGDSDGGVVMRPDPTPPVEAPPADPAPAPTAPEPTVYTSEDGTRAVTISADGNQTAYLSDTAETPSFEPVWLGDGVTDVKFKADDQGNLIQILTLKADGSFDLFDQNGFAVSQAPAESVKYLSPDNSRAVTVDPDGTATLEDMADEPAFEPYVFATGATSASFKLDDQGVLIEIDVTFTDGSVAGYDAGGNALPVLQPVDPAPAPEDPGTTDPAKPLQKSLMKSGSFESLRRAVVF